MNDDTGKPHDAITLDQFRGACVDFIKEAATLDERTLESAWSAIGKLYLGVWPLTELNQFHAVGALELASKHYWDRKMDLQFGGNPLDKLKQLLGVK